MLTQFAQRISGLICRRPWLTVFIGLVLAGGSGLLAQHLEFNASFSALLPEGSREVTDLNVVKDKAGGTGEILIAIGGKTDARLPFARQIVEKLRPKPWIRFVDVEYPVDFFLDRRLLLLETEKLNELNRSLKEEIAQAKVRANPLYVDLEDDPKAAKKSTQDDWAGIDQQNELKQAKQLLQHTFGSKDGKYLFVRAKPKVASTDFGNAGQILTWVQQEVAALGPQAHGLNIAYSGSLIVNQDQHRTLISDLSRAGAIALVLVVLLVTIHTRHIASLLILAIPLIIGIAISMGLTQLVYGRLNLISGFLVTALSGLGIEYEIHLYLRYLERRKTIPDRATAMRTAFSETLRGSITSAFANAACFLCLTISDFRGFREYGFIAAYGIFATFLSSYIFLPPLAVLFSPKKNKQDKAQQSSTDPVIYPFRRGFAWSLVLVGACVFFFGAYHREEVRLHNNFKKLRGYSPAMVFQEYVEGSLGGSLSPTLIMVNNLEDTKRVEAFLEKWKKEHPGSGIDRVFSMQTILPRDVPNRLAAIKAIRATLQDAADEPLNPNDKKRIDEALALTDVKPWLPSDIPDVFRRHFISVDGVNTFIMMWSRYEMYEDSEILAWGAELNKMQEALEKETGVKVPILDENRVASRVLKKMADDLPFVMAAAALMVFLLLLIDFRNFYHAALVAGSLAVGIFWLVGLMYLWGLEFNVFNQAVVPTLFGMGVDNAVHFQHRYLQEGKGSLAKVFATTGAAGFLASATNGIGFGATLTAHHAGIESMGMLSVIGFSCTFLSTTVFLPSVLRILERKTSAKVRATGAQDRDAEAVSPATPSAELD